MDPSDSGLSRGDMVLLAGRPGIKVVDPLSDTGEYHIIARTDVIAMIGYAAGR